MVSLQPTGVYDDSAPPKTVPASGELSIVIRVPYNQHWKVTQISAKMDSVPAGAELELHKIGQFIAHAFSARRAEFTGDPPLEVRGGEYFSIEWTGVTPGDVGRVYYQYEKFVYA